MERLQTEVLVVGGGAGGTAAALQAARRGAQTVLVSEFDWLGGMLTSAGVSAPDGNELNVFQTGIWGAWLRELERRHPEGLNQAWVSFFTYWPQIGAAIFADWVRSLPNLHWIAGQTPLAVQRVGDRPSAVRFADYWVEADIILDGTELGDLLALADVPSRWGWELQTDWGEPSAPAVLSDWMQRYPVQAPTWVVMLQDFETAIAPPIDLPSAYDPDVFNGAWEGYGVESFLNYGRLPGNRLMLNWPQRGNDYGEGCDRLVESESARHQFMQEAHQHSLHFAHFLQSQLGRRYGLAADMFPRYPGQLGGGAFALHPYFRESRRLVGLTTVCELDILPQPQGCVAALPLNPDGQVEAIAIGNYANDHHYPNHSIPLQPKSIQWGGRWTGTPFTIPYRSLIPANTDGLLVCEKNISVSHIANGATRLQPLVLGIGQAAGMAAALCIEQHCQPRELSVRALQQALLQDPTAPTVVIPLFHPTLHHPDGLQWQQHYLNHPEDYPLDGLALSVALPSSPIPADDQPVHWDFKGRFRRRSPQTFELCFPKEDSKSPSLGSKPVNPFVSAQADPEAENPIQLVTLDAAVYQQLQVLDDEQAVAIIGQFNPSGNWILVESIVKLA